MLQNQTDETLVMLTLAGEQDAYEVLVRRYQRAVVSAAASVTHNPFMAEDAAQDAFVTAWMKLDTLQEPQKFAAWVCRIAKNCALNQLRRFHSYLPLDVVDNLPLADDRNCDPAEAFVSSEERPNCVKRSEGCRRRCSGSFVCIISTAFRWPKSRIGCVFLSERSSGSFMTAENGYERSFAQ